MLKATDELLAVGKKQPTLLEAGARDFAFSLSNLFIGAVFLEAAARESYRHSEILALR